MHDFQVWRLARESWKFAVIHWPWHASLRYLAELDSQLRQTYDQTQVAFECCSSWAAAPTATVLKQVHHRPCNKDVLDSWLSTASQSRQFSSTALLERRLRETDESWTQTATVLVVRSLACHFCFSCWGHCVTTEWNIYTKTSFKRRKSRSARQHFESSNLSVSQVLVPPSMSMFFDMSIAGPSYRNASQFPWKTDAILAFSQAALRRTFEPP